jgi:hypothetical protein
MGLYSEDVVLIVKQQPKTAKIAIGEEKSQFFWDPLHVLVPSRLIIAVRSKGC